jgi:8-oxo-dGTP pyrophosphatase MutT (NUDIX family)
MYIISLQSTLFLLISALLAVAACRESGGQRCHHRRWGLGTRQSSTKFDATYTTQSMSPLLLSIQGGGAADENPTLMANDANSATTVSSSSSSFEILGETVVYSGWRTILQRKVQMRNGKVVDFDLVGVKTGEGAVLIFAWDSRTRTATMIREYMPASHRVLYGLAAGLIEDKHGHDTELAARHELEEECHLKGGKWILLTEEPVAMDKYSTTKMYCYLVIDPEPEENPKPLDDEEDIEIVSGVTIPEIREWIAKGEMNLVGSWGALLAIEKLRDLGEYP